MASSRMYLLVKYILISHLTILIAKSSRALLCLPCDESKCEEPKLCSGAVVLGICGCCSVCAKQKNETCGGVYGLYGTCDRGLRCVIRPPLDGGSITQYEVGVCEEEKPDCSKARCEVQFSPRCLEDSVLIEGYAPAGECCPLPSRCVCNPAGCLRKVCQPGYLNILVSKGSGKPEECCDLYECKPVFSVDCSTVECPPVQQVQCPPDSYETQVRLTADGCCTLPTRCECLPGPCGFPHCPTGSSPRVIARANGSPGTCCDVLECVNETKPACLFNGVEYYDGDMFRMDACRFCRCQGGVSVCFSAQCGVLHCERYYVPEGECCPVCEDISQPVLNYAGCYANGQILAHGDHWREDDCTFCQCVSGEARCLAAACGHSCLNPVTVPGECCPVCEEPTYITMAPPACSSLRNCSLTEQDCIYGYKRDQNNCRLCQCRTREELCRGLISGCTLACPFGFQTDVHSCAICQCRPRPKKCKSVACDKDCPFGFIKNKHGCDICRCKKCPEVPCDKACPLGFQLDPLGCLMCQCRDPGVSSVAPSVKLGSCLSMDGRRHENGENWHDGCRDCYCHSGREMCALISCPVPACANPTIWSGQCCPSCPGDPGSHNPELGDLSVCLAPGGEYFVEGETWNIDSCTQCTCHGGRVLCEAEVCPPLLCQSPVRTQDSCCPHCPDGPFTPQPPSNDRMPSYCRNEEGDIFLAAESWKPNMCSSCICLDGVISCFSESCPVVGCTKPVLRKGQCCPYCLEDTAPRAVCHFNGKTYVDEERWDIDSCTHCYCLQGQTLCSTVSCPALPCHNPVYMEGSCCPLCSGMYPPTNIPIEKTDQRGDSQMHQPAWPTRSENDIMPQFRGNFGSLQMPYLDGKTPVASEDDTLHSVAWVALPVLMMLVTISIVLLINQKKQWIPVPCYRTPTKPTCLNNQLVYVDCQKGTKVQVDRSQRMLRIADPDSRYSGYYSMQKQNNLQADSFHQTV
ncbi:cysteine-rich motor neuron 1 protein isoform X2 [Paramormyrops kingsleyae]|uniref:Cysteine rich transmembrane BMP regulator 1 (chordin-like) n=1 Tax=Paramormyrops kingsleyae TaxID=1676925 RepID=A0A3B3STJ3_9TELE|nr:cysteine-rich motor neuron 1 protein isoform X2 [Paramormyrops kingsleyae]